MESRKMSADELIYAGQRWRRREKRLVGEGQSGIELRE